MSLSIAGRWIKRLLVSNRDFNILATIGYVQKPEKRECCKKGLMQLVKVIPRGSGKHPHKFIRPPNDLAPATY